MRNKHGYWVDRLTAERHLENIAHALKRNELECALFDAGQLKDLLELRMQEKLEKKS